MVVGVRQSFQFSSHLKRRPNKKNVITDFPPSSGDLVKSIG